MTKLKKKISSLVAITLAVSAISVSSASLVVNASSESALDMNDPIANSTLSYAEGIINPGVDEWWESKCVWRQYMDDEDIGPYFPVCTFEMQSIDVVCKGQKYTVPWKRWFHDEISARYDYEISSFYKFCVKVDYNTNTAKYYLDPGEYVSEMGYNNTDVAYFEDYALIPISDVYSDENGQLHSYSGSTERLNMAVEKWWESKCVWRQYMDDEDIGPFFPVCTFDIYSIDVVCRGQEYTVPWERWFHDEISARYDYELSSSYKICIKVDYKTNTAKYYLDPGEHDSEMGYSNPDVAYFKDYALIPITDVYSDENGQLIEY